MNCSHLAENVQVDVWLSGKSKETGMTAECAVCGNSSNSWICLACGLVHCGRYVNEHGVQHSRTTANHNACMEIGSYSVYCYTCDDYVINDTGSNHLDKVRSWMQTHLKAETDPLCLSENNAVDLESNSSMSAVADDDQVSCKSGNSDTVTSDINEAVVRSTRQRGRKRSHSNDSGSENAGKSKWSNMRPTRSKKTPLVGLRNLGNTCFMNSVLQSLSSIQEFNEYFKQLPSLERPPNGRKVYHSTRSMRDINDEIIAEELRKVLISLNQGNSKEAISPNELFSAIWKVVPRFRGYQQQDAHEFLRYMLDRLHTELLGLIPDSVKDNPYVSQMDHKGRSIVTTIFGGTLQSEVRCLNCKSVSKKHDPFLDLSLDIPDKYLFNQKKGKDGDDYILPCSISDCLSSFIEVEELAETELYYCNSCKSKQRSTKRFWIRRLPNVLCLHLKRFRWNAHFRTKIDVDIAFPTTALDMSQFVLSNMHETRHSGTGTNLYDLAAVIVHHGTGIGSGHYTAFAINDGEWFHFNDSTVRSSDGAKVAKSKPYILFYIRRELTLPRLQPS